MSLEEDFKPYFEMFAVERKCTLGLTRVSSFNYASKSDGYLAHTNI